MDKDSILGGKEKFLDEFLKEEEFFTDKNIEDYKNLSGIHNDEDLVSRLKGYYKEQYDFYEKKFKEANEKEKTLAEKVRNEFLEKWDYYYKTIYEDYHYFGALLDVIKYLSPNKESKEYVECKAEIENYLFQKNIDFNKYCKALDVDKKEKEDLKKMLKDIFKDKDLKL